MSWTLGLPLIGGAVQVGGMVYKHTSQHTFRFRNDMEHNVVIQASEKNNSRPRESLRKGEWYTVDFRPNVSTLWWVDIQPWLNSDENTHFDCHHGHEKSHSFYLCYDGIYKMDLDGSNKHFFMKWSGH